MGGMSKRRSKNSISTPRRFADAAWTGEDCFSNSFIPSRIVEEGKRGRQGPNPAWEQQDGASSQVPAFKKLDAPHDVSIRHHILDAKIADGFKFLADFRRKGSRGRNIVQIKIPALVPPAGKPIRTEPRHLNFADEDRVLSGAVEIVRPEVKLIVRLLRDIIKGQRVRTDTVFGF